MTDLARILAEQREARDYILSGGKDSEGAWLGMSDWVTEEVLMPEESAGENYVIHCGDALETLRTLSDASVHCCITSPPYWGLRDYGTATWEGGDSGCNHSGVARRCDKEGRNDKQSTQKGSSSDRVSRTCIKCGATRVDQQLGLEVTPDGYVTSLVEVFGEVRRVLRDDGTLWLNIGDSYARMQENNVPQSKNPECLPPSGTGRIKNAGLKPKDLVGIPWRVAFALQADGWWLRSDIIWHKPNPMPESVTDRPTKSHEYLFLLAKSERYFYDADAIKEAALEGMDLGLLRGRSISASDKIAWHAASIKKRQQDGVDSRTAGTGYRNRRSVWTLTTLATPEAHFATFPIELPELCLRAGCPVDGTVLDPFAGAGTTGLACLKHGRRFVGIELNAEYVRLAYARARQKFPLFAPTAESPLAPAPEP